MQESASHMIARARAAVRGLSADEVALAIVHNTATVIDVREAEELQLDGRIVPSQHVPRGVLELLADPSSPEHLAVFDPAARMIVVCSNGARSALAAATLQQLGFPHITYLEGGLHAWARHGFPLDRPARPDTTSGSTP